MIPLSVSNPESIINARLDTIKDKLERSVKTLHKTGTFHIEISEELEKLGNTSLGKELHATCDPLIPVEDIIIYIQTEKHTYLEANINPICFRPFGEASMPTRSVAVKWN